MTTVAVVKRELKEIEQHTRIKRGPTIRFRMWLPDSDPRSHMTDEEIIKMDEGKDIIILPLREKP